MKPATFHPEALAEFQFQAVFYEEQSAGLGERYAAEVEAAVRLAERMPGVGSAYRHGTRRVFARHFPCAVVYRERGDSLVIIAVAHFRREPGYWRHRR